MKSRLWLALLVCVAVAYAATALTISDVIKMSKAGLSDDVIIQTLLTSKSAFQLTPEDVKTLVSNGVSDHVIVAMTVKGPAPSRPANSAQSTTPSVPPRPIVSDYVGADNQPNLSSSTAPAQNAVPFVAQPSGNDYYAGAINEPVVRALPPSPQVYYYAAPPPTTYYYYPYYYAPGPYYYSGPSVGFYFGRGGYWGGHGGWGHGGHRR